MTDDVSDLINATAAMVARKHPSSTFHRLALVGHSWVTLHPKRVGKWTEDGSKAAWSQLCRAIERELVVAARAEKAFAAGYHPDDEAHYSADLIAAVLPALFDDGMLTDPPTTERSEARNTSDPAITTSWPVHVADVRTAWTLGGLTADERSALIAVYVDGCPPADMAQALSLDLETFETVLDNGMGRLIEVLGGPRVVSCRNCEECGSR